MMNGVRLAIFINQSPSSSNELVTDASIFHRRRGESTCAGVGTQLTSLMWTRGALTRTAG